MECCYGDECESLPVGLVSYKYCGAELHHACQTKYEFTYGIDSDMIYICRPCVDTKHHDAIETAKQQTDDDTDTDAAVDLCGDKDSNDEAAANAVEAIDVSDCAVVVSTRTEKEKIDDVIDKEVASEETNDNANEEKTDDTVQATTSVPTPCQSERGKAKMPTTARNLST